MWLLCGCGMVAGSAQVAATMKKESSISICYEYTVDLESSGLSIRVQVPSLAPEFARTSPAWLWDVFVLRAVVQEAFLVRRREEARAAPFLHSSAQAAVLPGHAAAYSFPVRPAASRPRVSSVHPFLPWHHGPYRIRPRPCSFTSFCLYLSASCCLLHRFAKGRLFILTGTLPCLSLTAESCRETGAQPLEIRPSLGYEKRLSWLASRSPCRMMRVLHRIII